MNESGAASSQSTRVREVTGVILAGGQARRMGGIDKGLVTFCKRHLVEWVIDAVRPQVTDLLISANRNQGVYRSFGLPILADDSPHYPGPLAGIHSALKAARTPRVLVLPCDNPHPPADLCARLLAALDEDDDPRRIAVAHDGNRIQPVYALIPTLLADEAGHFLASERHRLLDWLGQYQLACADFSDSADAFHNINTYAELAALEQRLSPCGKAPE